MQIYSYDYNLQNSGALEDYIYAIHQFAVSSVFWEVESVSPASPTNANITELIIRLQSNTAIRIRFTPLLNSFTRNTILIYFSDGSNADWGDVSGGNWSPPCYIDGFINTNTIGAARGFNSATLGAQATTGNKGCTFVETEDMCAMFVYGKSTYASNWQFGFMAGKLIDWHLTGVSPWSIMSGNPCHLSVVSTTANFVSSAMPQSFSVNVPSQSANTASKCAFTSFNDEAWLGMGALNFTSAEFFKKVGDPSGTLHECLAPIYMATTSTKGPNGVGQFGGFTRYVRMVEADQSLDNFYDSPFSSTISWRAQTWNNGSALDTRWAKVVWIWPKGSPTTVAGTALT